MDAWSLQGKIIANTDRVFLSVVSLSCLPMDILCPVVGSRILRQQRLGPVGLLLRDFLLAGRETFFGQGQRRQTHLVVPSVGGRQQAPGSDFLVFGAQRIVQMRD